MNKILNIYNNIFLNNCNMILQLFINDFFKKYNIIKDNIYNKKFDEIKEFGNCIMNYKKDFNLLNYEEVNKLILLLDLYLIYLENENDLGKCVDIYKQIFYFDDNILYKKRYANLFIKNNQEVEAMNIYKNILIKEEDYESYFKLYEYYYKLKDYKTSKNYFKKCFNCIPIDEKNNIPKNLNLLAYLYYLNGNYNKYLIYSYNSLIFKISIDNRVNILGFDLLKVRDIDIIKTCLDELLQKYPKYKLLFNVISLIIPEYYDNEDEYDKYKKILIKNLDILLDTTELDIIIDNLDYILLDKIKINCQDKDTINKINILFKKLYKKFHTLARHVKQNKINNKKRIGFFNNYKIKNIIEYLDDKYEIFIFTNEKLNYKNVNNIIYDNNLENTQKIIADTKLDILFFTDINTNITTYLVALGRLAHKQIAFYNDYFCGLKNIDHYINSDFFYDNVNIINQPIINKKKIRLKYGLPLNLNFYLVPTNVSLIDYNFDDKLFSILDRDEYGFIVFLKSKKDKINELFYTRINNKFSKYSNNIKFIEYNENDYLNLIYTSDIILDINNNIDINLDSFNFGKIIISNSNDIINNFYEKMNLEKLIFNSNYQFIQKAIYYANYKKERNELEQNILNNKYKIFEDKNLNEFKKLLS
jgi:hypothetical protein